MDIFDNGKYEGIAYLREISTGQEIVSVSDEKSNISLRGLRIILVWLIRFMKRNGFSLKECEIALHEIVYQAFDIEKSSNFSSEGK